MIKLYIDPGHGGKDPGAVANGLKEKDLVLDLGLRIREVLSQDYEGIAIKMSRTSDTFPSLTQRTNEANSWSADYFLSIHLNSGGGDGGFETFIYPQADAATAELQKVIHNAIKERISPVIDRGMKKKDLHVLRESRMKALLTEGLFVDNVKDANRLKDPHFLEQLAIGHVIGIVRAFGLKKKGGIKLEEQNQNQTQTLYKVQVGAYAERSNAEKIAKELNDKGYPTVITQENK